MNATDWFIVVTSALVITGNAVQMINLIADGDRSWGMNALWIVAMLLNIQITLP